MSLAYYASSRLDRFNGLMIVSSGIEFSNYEKARDEIMVQLNAVKSGDFTDEDIKVAKNYIINSYRSYLDSPYLMKDFYLAMSFSGARDTLEDAIKKVETVTKEDIVNAFSSVNLDTVYFLKGEEA
jgi:predicted Zn-dependent peptidase